LFSGSVSKENRDFRLSEGFIDIQEVEEMGLPERRKRGSDGQFNV